MGVPQNEYGLLARALTHLNKPRRESTSLFERLWLTCEPIRQADITYRVQTIGWRPPSESDFDRERTDTADPLASQGRPAPLEKRRKRPKIDGREVSSPSSRLSSTFAFDTRHGGLRSMASRCSRGVCPLQGVYPPDALRECLIPASASSDPPRTRRCSAGSRAPCPRRCTKLPLTAPGLDPERSRAELPVPESPGGRNRKTRPSCR